MNDSIYHMTSQEQYERDHYQLDPPIIQKNHNITERFREEFHKIIGPHEPTPENASRTVKRRIGNRNSLRDELHRKVNHETR